MECTANFTGVVIPPGKQVPVRAEFDEDIYETLHFTQAALGEEAKPGPHTIFVEKDGQKFAIGTLDATRCLQFSCDITFAMDQVVLSHSGASAVHLTGYRVERMMAQDGSDDEYARFGSEEDSEEEEEESDEEEAPNAVPLKLGSKPAKPRARMLIDDEAEEGSSEEEEEEEEEEEDEESEEEQGARRLPSNGRLVEVQGFDGSSEEEQLSSGEEEEEEEESEEEPAPPPKKQPAQQQKQPQAGSKRTAAPQPAAAKTPQPAKKARAEQQQKAPATAPAKVPSAAAGGKAQATPSNEKEYLQALKATLQEAGQPMKLAALGGKVKRPATLPKFKHFIDKHTSVFKYDKEADTVALA